MQISVFAKAARVGVAAGLLAGCSGGTSQLGPISQNPLATGAGQHGATLVPGPLAEYSRILGAPESVNHRPSWIVSEAKRLAGTNNFVFVCNIFSGVDIYPATRHAKTKVGEITNGVHGCNGVGVDRHHNVYVTNANTYPYNCNVTVYKPPYTGAPRKTYETGRVGYCDPVAVAIGNDGSVYVSDLLNGLLIEYAPDSTTPTVCNLPGYGEGLALDASNNLWIVVNTSPSGPGGVYEYASGAGCSGQSAHISLAFGGGLTFDSSGNMLVEDQFVGVEVFPPGATSPSQTITGFSDAYAMVFDRKQNHLYVNDPGAYSGNGATIELSYPAAKVMNRIQGPSPSLLLGVGFTPEAPK
jgi:hypothetical protein